MTVIIWSIVPTLVGNPFVCKLTQWTIRAPSKLVRYHASAAAAPAHQYLLQNVFKLLMSNFYACSTYTNQIIFKMSQLTAYKFFAKTHLV